MHKLREDLFSTHLLSQNLGREIDTSDYAEAACVGDSSGKLRTRCDVHPCKNCELSYCEKEPLNAPARRIGCLIPNTSVIGVEMTDILADKPCY